jgi:hypothetical protein
MSDTLVIRLSGSRCRQYLGHAARISTAVCGLEEACLAFLAYAAAATAPVPSVPPSEPPSMLPSSRPAAMPAIAWFTVNRLSELSLDDATRPF